jgi:predicted ATPase/DNA-binding SARP family transcriptional activator/Tfp pilus assembly protein PilF
MYSSSSEEEVPESQISFQLLGSPHIECAGETMKVETRKASALLFYLAVTGETHTRDALSAMLWPESDQAHGRGALRRTLAALRKTVLKEWLEIDRECLTLRPGDGLSLDVAAFRKRLAACTTHGHAETDVCSACLTPLIEAVNLYRGDFLTGFSLGNCPIFDDWQFFMSEDLRREMTGALERLVHFLTAQKQYESAIAYARRWLSFDPLHEPAHRELMQLYAGTGQRNAALRQYQECVRILEEELGIPPLEETTQLYQYLQDFPEGPVQVRPQHMIGEPITAAPLEAQPALIAEDTMVEPAVAPAGIGLQNFPLPTTPFVGREDELENVLERLHDPNCRLLTLLGHGGMGKTRLGIQAAHCVNFAFPDGVYFIPLSPLSSPTSLIYTVADILHFSFYSNRDPMDDLLDYLREKKMLLLMDNFEHLVEAADFLQKVLETAPDVKFLVTSRERMNLKGEWVIELQGLKVPAVDKVEQIGDYSAMQLFFQCANRIGGERMLSEKDQPDVIHICQLIGGVPLGIELAAAWVRLLTPQEIAQEIEHNLDFLVASSRDIPERHQSLRAVFEHSWKLLPLEEQRIFRRMSVFQGGFQKEAAQRVAGASLAALSSLVDKSLLLPSHSGRYNMHIVLRQYAEEKLEENLEERIQTRDRHSQYYAEFLNQRTDHLRRGQQEEAGRVIGEEIENIRLGWRWAIERLNQTEMEKYIDPQYNFYEMRGWLMEGEEIFDLAGKTLTDHADENTPEIQRLLAKVLARQGGFAQRMGEARKARELLERSLAISRLNDDKGEIAICLNYLGELTRLRGEYTQARKLVEESIQLCKETGEFRRLGRATNLLGIIAALTGDYAEAQEHFQEGLSIFKKFGDLWWVSKARENLANVANLLGNYEEASALYQESLVTFRRIHDQHGVSSCLLNIGIMAHAMGEYQQAVDLYQESLEISREIGVAWSYVLCLNYLGKSQLALGNLEKADEYFHRAFKASVDIGAVPFSLSVLVGMASLAVAQGNPHRALEYLTIVVNHPSCDQESRDWAEEQLLELEGQIPRTAITKAREALKNQYLKKLILVAEEILKQEEERNLNVNST